MDIGMKLRWCRRGVLVAGVVAVTLGLLSSSARATVVIDWVLVGNPGNANDVGTNRVYGAVSAEYAIMKFEWTNAQYVAFLNAVDPEGLNPQSLYNVTMGSNFAGGISFSSANANGTKYATRTNYASKPVTYVGWWDAARVANWLHNGAPVSQVTDSSATAPQNFGAYSVGTSTTGNVPLRNAGARYWIPTESQWYKAAYYNGDTASYTNYGNGFSTDPTPTSANSSGVGAAGDVGNFANYNRGAKWQQNDGSPTTVGTNGGPSFYGAFDMSGNLQEWNDLTSSGTSSNRGQRGGFWFSTAAEISAGTRSGNSPATLETNGTTFRLAADPAIVVPEPGTLGLAVCGAIAGLGAWRVRSRRWAQRPTVSAQA